MNTVYLDNNATTRVAPEVIDTMEPFFGELWGNPSSMHEFGGQVAKHVETAREKVAALINADPSEIIFTSCGTESDNMAIRGCVEEMPADTQVITSRVEHLAVLGPERRLKETGHATIEIGVDNMGQLDLTELEETLNKAPSVVSIMWANNETGVVFPMQQIAELVKDKGGIIHTDAVQAVGKLPVNVKQTPVDMLSLSGHKLHAPKGIGALYIRKGVRIRPFLIGGHQESGKRGGTENVPYIAGLGKACELAAAEMEKEENHVRKLRDKLEAGILETCSNVTVNGDREMRLPNTTNLSFEFIEGEAILYSLSDEGIAASSGSACTSGSLEPSHVIRAMGIPFTLAHGSIRFSLSRYNTEDEINYALEKIPPVISHLREMSPFT
ncbi:MAG: cysteine desulfurase NifS [Verrucomicrobiota bacterium]